MNVQLDKRIRIEAPPTARDPVHGTLTGDWAVVGTVWAEMNDVLPSKGERVAAGINIANRPSRVRIRYTTLVDSSMRIVVLDRAERVMMIVTRPAELGRAEYLEFIAEENSTQGAA